MTRPRFRAALAPALLLAAAGCAQPTIEGGQIPKPPPGFAYDPNCAAYGLLHARDELVGQRCWFTREEPHSSITVSEFKGGCDGASVASAREAYVAKNKYLEFGPIESLAIDGQPAWGWLETQSSNGALHSLKYTAAVCYRTRRYVVEYFAADPRFRDAAAQRAVVKSFRVITSRDVDPWKVGVAVVLVVAVALGYRRFSTA